MLPPGRWLSCQYEFFLAILSNRLVIFAEALINWKLVEDKMPWQLVFLLGILECQVCLGLLHIKWLTGAVGATSLTGYGIKAI